MANVTINDEHLIAIGEALRSKLGATKLGETIVQKPLPLVYKTNSASSSSSLGAYQAFNSTVYTVYTVPGASGIRVKATVDINSSSCELAVEAGSQSSFSYGTQLIGSKYSIGVSQSKTVDFTGTDTVTIKVYQKQKFYIQICGLDADGNEMAYYEELGEGQVPNTFKPRDMAAGIESIAFGNITTAHKIATETLEDGTLTFDLSVTNGNFVVLLATNSTDAPVQIFAFNNGVQTKENKFSVDVGRLYGLDASDLYTYGLEPIYSDGILSVPVAADGTTTLVSNYITYIYMAKE